MKPQSSSAGGALITAIFLIIVLVALGVAISKLSNVTQDTTTKASLSAKVYYGAKAGLEWGIQQAVGGGSCAGGSPSLSGALTGISVTVTCASSTHGAGNIVFHRSQAEGLCATGGVDHPSCKHSSQMNRTANPGEVRLERAANSGHLAGAVGLSIIA